MTGGECQAVPAVTTALTPDAMGPRVAEMAVNVRWLLSLPDRQLGTMFTGRDGVALKAGAVRLQLLECDGRGMVVIPARPRCGKPCTFTSCAGFDFGGGGCPGHLVAEESV